MWLRHTSHSAACTPRPLWVFSSFSSPWAKYKAAASQPATSLECGILRKVVKLPVAAKGSSRGRGEFCLCRRQPRVDSIYIFLFVYIPLAKCRAKSSSWPGHHLGTPRKASGRLPLHNFPFVFASSLPVFVVFFAQHFFALGFCKGRNSIPWVLTPCYRKTKNKLNSFTVFLAFPTTFTSCFFCRLKNKANYMGNLA